jgi:uncharacterized membrane protein
MSRSMPGASGSGAAVTRLPLVAWVIAILVLIEAAFRFSAAAGIGNAVIAVVTILGGLVFLLLHGSQAFGWRNLIAFLLITVVVSFAAEAIGVATGWVFGPYHYTDQIGPKLLGVPPLIQIAYAAMGYASLITGRVLMGASGAPRRWPALLAVTLIGALIMVGWDLGIDPFQSTISGIWIWHQPGPYFGVGIHNFIGWFGTVFTFMLLYQIYARRFPEQPNPALAGSPFFWSLAPFFYIALGLGTIVPAWIGGYSLPYASPANYSGSLPELESSVALITAFAMGTPAIAALLRLSGVAKAE